MVVSEPPDPFYANHFQGRKRKMELQFQGKFLTKPTSTLWIGGEIQEKMNIGIMLRTVAGMMLRLVKKISHGKLHHSFGHAQEDEIPCIVTSFFHGVDRLHITPPGSTPPLLGRDLPENDDAIKRRRKASADSLKIDVDSIYSFSYQSMYIDLLNWKVVRIPGMQGIDLHSYWGNLPLVVPLYEMEDKPYHATKRKNYFFRFEFMHTSFSDLGSVGGGGGGGPLVVFPKSGGGGGGGGGGHSSSKGDDNDDDGKDRSSYIRRRSTSVGSDSDMSDGGGDTDHEFFRKKKKYVIDVPAFLEISGSTSTAAVFDKRAVFVVRVREKLSRRASQSQETEKGKSQKEQSEAAFRNESTREDGAGCLLCDANDLCEIASFATGDASADLLKLCKKMKGIRLKTANLPMLEAKRRSLDSLLVDMSSDQQQLVDVVLAGVIGKSAISHLLSRMLAERRYKVVSNRMSSQKMTSKCTLEGPVMLAEWETFWREGWATLSKIPSSSSSSSSSSFFLSFYRAHSSSPSLCLYSEDIMKVTLTEEYVDLPLPTTKSGFQIHTYGRVINFAASTQAEAGKWVRKMTRMLGKARGTAKKGAAAGTTNWVQFGENHVMMSDGGEGEGGGTNGGAGCGEGEESRSDASWSLSSDPTTLFLNSQCLWAPGRHVLNCRRLSFASDIRTRRRSLSSSTPSSPSSPSSPVSSRTSFSPSAAESACALSTECLRSVLKLRLSSSVDAWTTFLDRVAMLKEVNLLNVSNDQHRYVFWMNVYHTLLLHSRLMLGSSNTPYRFFKHARSVAYDIFAFPHRNVFSLHEIEHFILRGRSTKPSTGFITTMFLPTCNKDDVKWDMAPRSAEPRLNLILNYATTSSPSRIPVFVAAGDGEEEKKEEEEEEKEEKKERSSISSIDRQLDVAASSFLKHCTVVHADERKVYMPKVLDWYRNDFLSSTETNSSSGFHVQHELLVEVQRLLLVDGDRADGEIGLGIEMTELMGSSDGSKAVSIHYQKFSWEPQPLGSLRAYDVSIT